MSDGENCPTQFLSTKHWCSFYSDTKQETANLQIWEAEMFGNNFNDSFNNWHSSLNNFMFIECEFWVNQTDF